MTRAAAVAGETAASLVREAATRLATEPAIRIDGLAKQYGGRRVLDGVSLTVEAGEIVALLGPNGAGKTTTVEIVEGYRRADGGTVRVLGADPAKGGPALRARVGLMLQGGGLDPRTTPRDVVRLYAAFFIGGRDPEALLDLVGLRAVARTRVRRLSGGERQRLALALALVGDPEVLILDEPTAGMDPEAKRATRLLIADLRSDGRAILLTTHDLVDVERLADRVAILHRGRIVVDAAPADVLTQAPPRLRFRLAAPATTAQFEALAPWVRRASPEASVVPDPSGGVAAYVLEGAPPSPAVVAAVAWWAADHSVTIAELQTTAGTSLEDRYFELTGDRDVEAVA